MTEGAVSVCTTVKQTQKHRMHNSLYMSGELRKPFILLKFLIRPTITSPSTVM